MNSWNEILHRQRQSITKLQITTHVVPRSGIKNPMVNNSLSGTHRRRTDLPIPITVPYSGRICVSGSCAFTATGTRRITDRRIKKHIDIDPRRPELCARVGCRRRMYADDEGISARSSICFNEEQIRDARFQLYIISHRGSRQRHVCLRPVRLRRGPTLGAQLAWKKAPTHRHAWGDVEISPWSQWALALLEVY